MKANHSYLMMLSPIQANEDTDKHNGGKIGKPSGNHYSVRINQISFRKKKHHPMFDISIFDFSLHFNIFFFFFAFFSLWIL